MSRRAVVVGAGLTGVAVKSHLEQLGYIVDVIDDARAVAAQAPATGFAAALAAIETRLSAGDRVAV